jgi:hypothetical protein
MTAKKKETRQLTLVMEGNRITSERFLKAANNFFAMLKTVSDEVAGEKDSLSWTVSLKKGSLILVATPEPNKSKALVIPRAVKAIDSGIANMEKRSIRPRYFSDSALRNLSELGSVISEEDNNIQEIKVRYNGSVRTISQHSVANVTDILGTDRRVDGSVEGKVALISDRRGFRVYIDDLVTGQAVRCVVKKSLESKLIGSFRRRVVVSGIVHYRKDGNPISVEVHDIRMLGKRDDLPAFEDVRGILRD